MSKPWNKNCAQRELVDVCYITMDSYIRNGCPLYTAVMFSSWGVTGELSFKLLLVVLTKLLLLLFIHLIIISS